MLNDILERVEAEKAGLVDPTEAEMKKPIEVHLVDFETYLKTKNSEPRYAVELVGKVRRCAEHCKWLKIGQIKT